MEKKTLCLSLKKEWYNMIESGVKKEEYREIKPYWSKRFKYDIDNDKRSKVELTCGDKIIKHNYAIECPYEEVKFSYGYTRKTMTFKIKTLMVGYGEEEWGATPNEKCYVIRLGERVN